MEIERFMKHIFLITLFLLPTHSSQSMNNSQKNNIEPSWPTQLCLLGIEDNNAKQVRKALLAGADVNYTNSNGESFFYLAMKKDNEHITIELITHKDIDLNVQDKYKYTPLHAACEFGLSGTVASMISKNSQATDARDHWGCTPLHIASAYGQEDCIDLLLNHNISNINWQDYDDENTALHIACVRKNFNCTKLLLKKNAATTIKNNNQATPLVRLFSCTNDVELYRFFTNEPLTANQLIHSTGNEYNNQLHLCTKLHPINYDKFEKYLLFLISCGVGINARNKNGKRPIDLACDEYNSCYNFYITRKFPEAKKILDNQEAIMHAFLRFTPSVSCADFQTILELFSLPQELKNYIGQIYYKLNIDTIIAKKYKHDKNYYDDFIENKNEIRNKLIAHLEPNLLWR